MSGQQVDEDRFPPEWDVTESYKDTLRYGENPHQTGVVYRNDDVVDPNIIHATQLNTSAKDLSFVNYLDAQSALDLVVEFDKPAAAVIKHTIPAGCATAGELEVAYERAHATDPMSAYGGIVALNRECDRATAQGILDSPFKTIITAPSYSEDARKILCETENIRVLEVGNIDEIQEQLVEKQLPGGRLVQERDLSHITAENLTCVTDCEPTEDHIQSLLFAWKAVKHVMSNGTVVATGSETVGIGSGQPSRIDSVLIATRKAKDHAEGKSAEGAVLATDGFAFPDTVEAAAEAGIEAIIQPGGSVRDEDVITAANNHEIAMVFTGQRCFKHG
ncbi:hypothetical protein [Halomontanus rarus]|uniref:hypothetical protein n=1 Tax=Halomontanus rarus TaxID=3034020 RepID=UPI00293BB1B4|nr:hypothetical protein [Halovivax sp. KZCA124]